MYYEKSNEKYAAGGADCIGVYCSTGDPSNTGVFYEVSIDSGTNCIKYAGSWIGRNY